MMNYLDLLIIYLACGSPFGVYYYFNNRQYRSNTLIKSLTVTFVWIPYSLKLLHTKITDKLNNIDDSDATVRLFVLQKNFENVLPSNESEISLFEFREIIERYKELTLISLENNGTPAKHEKEIYRIYDKQNVELSAICLNRRNHNRLLIHQIQARKDFLKTIKTLLKTKFERKKLGNQSLEFVRILNDEAAYTSIRALIDKSWQIDDPHAVTHLEKETWTIEPPQRSKEKSISMPLQRLPMRVDNVKKD